MRIVMKIGSHSRLRGLMELGHAEASSSTWFQMITTNANSLRPLNARCRHNRHGWQTTWLNPVSSSSRLLNPASTTIELMDA